MSLNKQISQFRIVVNSNTYDLPVQNMTSEPRYETFADSFESVGGRRYIRPAGLRNRIEIRYEANLDSTNWRNLINDILTHIVTNGNQFFDFYFDATETTASDKLEVQPEDIGYVVEYQNTIGTFIPSLSLIERDRITSITSNFEAP